MSRVDLESYKDYIRDTILNKLDIDLLEYSTIVNVYNSKYGKDMMSYYYEIGTMGDEVVDILLQHYLSLINIKT